MSAVKKHQTQRRKHLCQLPRRSGLAWAEKGSNQQRPSTSGDNSQIPFGLRKLRRQIKGRLQFWPEGKKKQKTSNVDQFTLL